MMLARGRACQEEARGRHKHGRPPEADAPPGLPVRMSDQESDQSSEPKPSGHEPGPEPQPIPRDKVERSPSGQGQLRGVPSCPPTFLPSPELPRWHTSRQRNRAPSCEEQDRQQNHTNDGMAPRLRSGLTEQSRRIEQDEGTQKSYGTPEEVQSVKHSQQHRDHRGHQPAKARLIQPGANSKHEEPAK